MDATKLIEEAERLSERASPGPWFERRRKGGFWAGGTPDGAEVEYGAVRAGDAAEEIAVCAQGRDWGADTSNGYNDACFIARARTLVPDLAAALKASEERARKAEDLAAANLAANKRIVELEHERDAARAELARLTTPQPGEPLNMDCGDNSCMFATSRGGMRTNGGCRCLESLGFCRGQTDSLRRMAAEVVSLRKRLLDLTTPRPIAEAPRDGTNILGVWLTSSAPEVMHWDGSYWTDEGEELVYKPSHYLPLPEVKP